MKKTQYTEDGREYVELTRKGNRPQHAKKKMSTGKKALIGLAGAVAVFGVASACSDEDGTTPTSTETTQTQVATQTDEAQAGEVQAEETQAAPEEQEADIPREYENALKKAESYLKFSAFSYNGLYDQLTSEFGSGFSAEAAQYAVDNVEADWYAEAVEAAESYLSFSAMSRADLLNQLTSEFGEGFTPEEAQYAVDTVY